MTTLTLLCKNLQFAPIKQLDPNTRRVTWRLKCRNSNHRTAANKWVQLELSGEDEAIATKLLEREMGFCPIEHANIKKFDTVKGYIRTSKRSKEQLILDIGIFEPTTIHADIPLSICKPILQNGKKITLKKLGELWGLCENLPLKHQNFGSQSLTRTELRRNCSLVR